VVRARQLTGPHRVRRLAPEDWRTYKQIRLAALTMDPHAFGSTLEYAQGLTEEDWRSRLATSPFFLGEVDGKAAGLAGGHRRDGYAELISMWVAQEFRGTGLAARLIDAVIEWAAGEGYSEIRLWVVEGNAAARKAYAKAGFEPTGRRERHREGEETMELEMARATSRPRRIA
jgi:RimJ/RimL family protein N-acetyltransferase